MVVIGAERAELWDRVENDRKTYPLSLWDWQRIEIALTQELSEPKQAA